MRLLLFSLIAVVLLCANASAAVFQYALPVETRKGERLAYLWIPAEAEHVRGLVVGGMTLMERELAQDRLIRKACADEQLGILFFHSGLNSVDLQGTLDRFAEATGYAELANVPMLFIGHSAGGPQARRRARQHADRCFGLVQYRGADPGDVDHDGEESIPPGIPALMMIGQFDEFGKIGRDERGVENWEKDRDKLLKFRESDPANLGSILVEPGAGHFAWSRRNAEYLAKFIPAAAKARIPGDWPADASRPPKLKSIDPASGWLTDPTIKTSGKFPPAPHDDYQGDRADAAWHLDRTLAEAAMAYHEGIGRGDQFIRWKDPHKVSAGARNFFDQLRWNDEGTAFQAHPVYADTYPQPMGGRGRWGKAGEPCEHADVPIQVKPVSGPLVAADEHALRIEFNELAPATQLSRITFMAFSEGSDTFRYTERVGMANSDKWVPREGKPQAIRFEQPSNLRVGGGPIKLSAASDAGLPVQFHVAYGPARVVDGKLEISELPRRAKLPIEVKVIAWQLGRPIKPLIQAAEPVERTLKVQPE